MTTQPPLEGMPAASPEAGNYAPFEGGRVPCAVVVDTRNMHGQSRKVFGRGLRPTANGIRKALREYGFEAVEIYAGVATKTMSNSPSEQVQSSMEDNRRYAVQLAQQDAIVLSGHLAERNGEMEEKQVDVLLALKIADLADRIIQLSAEFECIVVLSEDMDLMPAYEFAVQRGVVVYAAAYDTVHTRTDQTSWIILDEDSLRLICPPPANIDLGAPMRRQIARMATMAAPVEAPVWKVESWQSREIVLSNSRGVTGVLRSRQRVRKGDRLRLYAVGIEMERKSKRFPLLTLNHQREAADVFEGVAFAEVLHWVQPTRARVQIEGTGEKATLTASPGHLLPGQRIAVFQPNEDERAATYYVGPVGEPALPDDWPLPTSTAVVTISTTGHTQGAWRCSVDGHDIPVMVPKAHLTHADEGDRLRIALAGVTAAGVHLGQPLVCCLPVVSDNSDKTRPRG